MKQGEGGLMVFDNVTSLNPSWNNADWVVLVILVAFLALGLLFGAAKLGARIIGYPVAVLGSMVLANVVLPYLYPMGWYQSVISALWNNKTLVNWLFYILLTIAFFAVIFGLWKLIFDHLIDAAKASPLFSRILGLVLGFVDWAILLGVVAFLFSALPTWLGQNTPDWVTNAHNYLGSSIFGNKLIELFTQLVNMLGVTGQPVSA